MDLFKFNQIVIFAKIDHNCHCLSEKNVEIEYLQN